MNQVERDIEQHVLSQTKKLSDGTTDKIFVRHARGENGIFSYNCRLCGVANLVGEKSLQTHITGKKHQQRLMFGYIADATQFRAQLVVPVVKAASNYVHPGEPIPPGFENEMTIECHLDGIIASIDKPLIGLEYVTELHDSKAKEPLYVCVLCDKRCDPRNIIAQVTSHRHRMKYLDFHFPSLMAVLNRNHRFNTDMTYREEVLTHISKLLEQKFKRQKLYVCEYRDYERRKIQITEEIKNGKHFNESDFPDSEKILLEKFKLSDFDAVSSESDDDHFDNYVKESKNKAERVSRFADRRCLAEQQSAARSFPSYARIFASTSFASTSKDTVPRKILTPRELTEQANMKMQEKYIMEKYRALFQSTVNDLQKQLKEHQRNPEKHPNYGDEWKSFWSRRYKELISQGKDANGYDYKPEWIEFWMKRLRDLYEAEIETKRKELRKRYLISNDEAKKIEDEILNNKSKSRSPPKQRSPSPKRRRSRSPLRRRSRSPIEISDESSDGSYYRYRSSRSRTHERTPEFENEAINLVSVCRLLSVLENELGMLAQRILDLLSRGVAMEKCMPNSCDSLLLENDNMILMETAKEKLKGGLAAGLIQSHRISPVKRAITYIAKLIHEVSTKYPKQTLTQPKKIVQNESPKEVLATTDAAKMEIARAVIEALAAQGKTDVSAEELEALIESLLNENLNENENNMEKMEKMEVTEQPKAAVASTSAPQVVEAKKEESTFGLENLTDDDLKTLLRNFSELTSDEQNHLITYLSKIEKTEPARVEKLRKYVDMGDMVIDADEFDIEMAEEKPTKNYSPHKIASAAISDDEYEEDGYELIKSMNKNAGNSTITDRPTIVNDLMSSLMQSSSSMPQQEIWPNATTSYPIFQPAYSTNELTMQQEHFNQQMNVMGMMAQNQWPETSASTFVKETMNYSNLSAPGTSNFKNVRHEEHVPFRKRLDRPNNLQLTGKGKNKNCK